MKKMRRQWIISLLGMLACSAPLFVGAGCGQPAEGISMPANKAASEPPPQTLIESRVLMARPEVFDTFERPPVVFDHRKHTETLSEEGCQTCHPADAEGKVNYEYVAWRELADRRALIDAYHERCNQCHYEGATSGGKKVRALTCGECHLDTTEYLKPEWYPATFDHFPHIAAMEKGCDTCHHRYDEQQKKLVYEKGQEESCGNCHKDTPEENRDPLRKVGHTGCIGCHEKEYLAGNKEIDPYSCNECHRPEAKPSVPDEREMVARVYQANPGQLLISYPGAILPPVAFDHEKHDPKQECAKCCHNFHVRTLVAMDMRFKQTSDSCQQCHEKADISVRPGCVQADKIYHDPESPNSCIGCHTQKNKEDGEEKRPVSCKGCHKGTLSAAPRPVAMEPLDAEKGPETYVIARLSRKYLPVKFPHLQHTKMIPDCQSCHHHGPEKQMPTCNTCHGEPLDFMKLTKPRLISAYHRMCMGCHRDMGTGPVTCAKCHEERETIYPSSQHLTTSVTPAEAVVLEEKL
jgi:hypothetical protein